MLKNKNVKKFLLAQILIIIIAIAISIISSFIIYKNYRDTLIENNNRIINNIIKNNPELEEEIINAILDEDKSSTNILEQYGISDEIYELEDLKQSVILGNILLVAISIILIIIFYIIYIIREHQSLSKISTSVNKVLNNDYSIDIKEYHDDYLSSLSSDVYKVISLLKEQRDISYQDKKYLEETLSDISHQLRTPLTSMYVINDLLETKLSSSKKKEFLNRNRTQLERIEWLVTSLLKLSRLDSGSVELIKETVNLNKLIEASIDPVRISLELKEINVMNQVDKSIYIDVDFNWTKEALVNIIKNAYEYTPVKGKITINASVNPLYTELRITDNGCGIPKDKLPFIFDRFYKVNKDSDSIGIGLNMTKRIIHEQLGEIEVESKVKQGTTFIIKFYKNVI